VPCVIVIQGGGFFAQDGQRFRPFAVYLAEHGFAAALIAYRGKPDHTYMDTIADTKAAVRFVRKISGEYNMDSDRIGAMGRSAGGTLAALLAVTGDVTEFEGSGGHPQHSSRINAAVCYAGVFDFVARFTNAQQVALQPNADTKILANGEWIGVPFAAENEHWLRASAISHVSAGDPPIFFMHCKDDSVVPWLQSQAMHERMRAAGIASELKYYESGGHGFQLDDKEAPLREMVGYFRQVLGVEWQD
jgi:acetyl esterase/lipase